MSKENSIHSRIGNEVSSIGAALIQERMAHDPKLFAQNVFLTLLSTDEGVKALRDRASREEAARNERLRENERSEMLKKARERIFVLNQTIDKIRQDGSYGDYFYDKGEMEKALKPLQVELAVLSRLTKS